MGERIIDLSFNITTPKELARDKDHGCAPRLKKLREISHETQPHLDLKRALTEMEIYKQYKGRVSVLVLHALVLKEYFSEKEFYFGEDKLLVGERGPIPQPFPTFPETIYHSLEDMRIMNDRELMNFTVTEEQIRQQEEAVIPYQKDKATRSRIMEAMNDEWRTYYDASMSTEFMEQRSPGCTMGSKNFYIYDYGDYRRKVAKTMEELDFFNDPEAYDKLQELKAIDICYDAVITLGKRYHELVLGKAVACTDPVRKKELLQIAENYAVVPEHKPETYWQTLQMYWSTHLGVALELNSRDVFTPGRLDQHPNPFYEKDTAAGRLNDTLTLELLECLWVKLFNFPAPVRVDVTLKESGTYVDFSNINTDGVKEDGEDGVNRVSYLILNCMEDMRQSQPNSNVQISKKTPDEFLKRACEITRQGWGRPVFYSTDGMIEELVNKGRSLIDARSSGCPSCAEIGAWDTEDYILTGHVNIPECLELALHNGYNPMSKQQIGPKTGTVEGMKSYENVWQAFKAQFEHCIDVKIRGNQVIKRIFTEMMPAPFLSICTDDCISRDKGYNVGGTRYNTRYMRGVGISDVTDALVSIGYSVFDKKHFSLTELIKAMDGNLEGHPEIYNCVCNKAPKYGNDDEYMDEVMAEAFNKYKDYISGRPTVSDETYYVDMLPTTCHVYFGDVVITDVDGRHARMPLADGIPPTKGSDTNGPTFVVTSCAKMDQRHIGGCLLNQKLAPATLADQKGINNLAALIRSYFEMWGHHLQFSVINRETLIDAQRDPEKYKGLTIRVTGCNNYFNNLDPKLQDEIIGRTEQEFA